jgi:excisionase family DNA binding protein
MWRGLFDRIIELKTIGDSTEVLSNRRDTSLEKQKTQQPLLLNMEQVGEILGLSRSKVYKLIKWEGLPVIRFGRALRVSSLSLQQWVAEREEKSIA